MFSRYSETKEGLSEGRSPACEVAQAPGKSNMDSTTTMTSTSAASIADVPIDPIVLAYVVVGMTSLVSNLVILATLLSDRKLLNQSALIVGFAISHFLLGCNIGTSGIVRLVHRATVLEPQQPLSCLKWIYPIAYPLAFQSSALLLCLAGVERLTAVAWPHWFRKYLAKRRMWYLVAGAFGFVSATVSVAIAIVVPTLPATTRQCSQPGVMGIPYTSFGRLASAAGGSVAVVLTIAALIVGTKRIRKLPLLSGEAGKMRRQIQLTKAMLGVAFIDFCLVVIPNTISFLGTWGVPLPSFMGSLQSNVAFCVNATVAIMSYLIFNTQFRRATLKLFRIKTHSSSARVMSIGNDVDRAAVDRAATGAAVSTWAVRRQDTTGGER